MLFRSTIIWNEWILKGIAKNKTKLVMINPRRTMGVAYAEKHGGVHLDVNPGTDTVVHMALQRIILEKGWEDKEFIKNWTNNFWETDSGFGQGTRNTPWQWRTTWGNFQLKGNAIESFKEWLFSQEESKPEVAAKIAGIDPEKLYKAAELMARPRGGKQPKTTIRSEEHTSELQSH